MKSIVNKALYSLGGTFKTIGRNIGHLYEIIASKIIKIIGTNISVDNTIEAPMRIKLGASELEQIQTTQSANLLDEEYLKTATYGTATYKNTLTNIKGNRQLYVKAQLKTGKTAISGLYVRLSSYPNPTSSSAVYGIFISNGNAVTNSTPDFTGKDDLYFTYYPTDTNLSDIFDTYEFWVSTDDVSYVPFVPNSPNPQYPQEIHTISGDNTIKVVGSNLTNEDVLNENKNSDDGECYIFNNNKLVNVNLTPNITFKENTQYTIQYIAKQVSGNPRLRIVYTDSTTQNIGTDTIATTLTKYTQTSTANKTISYITEVYSSNTTNGFYIKKDSFCIKEGSDTTYTPYQEQTAQVNLGDLEYSKMPNTDYSDEFYRATDSDTSLVSGKWYLKKNIGKTTLDDATSLLSGTIFGTSCQYAPYSLPNALNVGRSYNFISNKIIQANETYIKYGGYRNNTNLYVITDTTDTLSNFNSNITGSIVYYPLSTSTYTLLNDTLQSQLDTIESMLLSYKGQTNISQVNDDLPFELEVDINVEQ